MLLRCRTGRHLLRAAISYTHLLREMGDKSGLILGPTMTDKIKISNLYKVFGKNPAAAMMVPAAATPGHIVLRPIYAEKENWTGNR